MFASSALEYSENPTTIKHDIGIQITHSQTCRYPPSSIYVIIGEEILRDMRDD